MIKLLLSVSLLSLLFISSSFSKDLNYKEKISFIKERVDLYFYPRMGLKQKVLAVNYAYYFVENNSNYIGKEEDKLIKRIELVSSKFWSEKRATELYHNVVKIHFTGKYLDKLTDKLNYLERERDLIEGEISFIKSNFPNNKLERRGDVIRTNYIPNSAYITYIGDLHSILMTYRVHEDTKIIVKEKFGSSQKPTFKYIKGDKESDKGVLEFTIGVDSLNWGAGYFYPNVIVESLASFSLEYRLDVSSFSLSFDQYMAGIWNLRTAINEERLGRLQKAGIKRIEIMENWENQDDLVKYGTLIVGVKQEDIEFIIDTLFPPNL